MAARKTKAGKRGKTTAKRRGKAPAPKKKAPARKAKATRGTKPARKGKAKSKQSELEGRWREYWRCRTDLEESLGAVREAEEKLATAQQLERTRRDVFDQSKRALESMLEVEPAGSADSASSRRLLEFPPADPSDDVASN